MCCVVGEWIWIFVIRFFFLMTNVNVMGVWRKYGWGCFRIGEIRIVDLCFE